MAPVFSHGDLRLYLLGLLEAEPRHGYDLIQALSDRTGGTYTPSAGTIYPRLAKLEAEGLVTKTADGRKTVYAITDAGRAELAARADDIRGIEEGLNDSVRLIADGVRRNVREAMRSLRADLAAAAQATAPETPPTTEKPDARMRSRERLARAEGLVAELRGRLRMEWRGHIARGGEIPAEAVDQLAAVLATALPPLDAPR